jgi:hypothetical protein
MGISETIVAAIIGALATVVTAVFQLVRHRPPSEGRPKKNRMRSALATVALGIACIVGGYAWSSLRAVSAKEELRATMKAELTEQLAALVDRKEQAEAEAKALAAAAMAASHGTNGSAEALVHLPPCRIESHPDEVGPVTCTDRAARSIAMCATIPAAALTSNVRVFARVPLSEAAWQERDAGSPTLGSLRIAESTADYPVNADQRSVCLEVANWSVEDTLAVRLLVDYAFDPKPAAELTAATPGAAKL